MVLLAGKMKQANRIKSNTTWISVYFAYSSQTSPVEVNTVIHVLNPNLTEKMLVDQTLRTHNSRTIGGQFDMW